MAIVFYLQKRTVGMLHEISIRLYRGQFDQRTGTRVFVPREAWDKRNGRCLVNRRYETPTNKQAREAQQQLDDIADFVARQYATATQHGADWLARTIERYYQPTNALPLCAYIDRYCTARNVMPQTRKKMQVLGRLMQQYDRQAARPLTQQLTRQDLDAFYTYLIAGGMRSENTARCRLRQLRTLLYWVGKPHPNPFDDYTIAQDAYGTPIYLTREERDFITIYKDLTLPQQVQRDIFIFQCHTGCRVGDLVRLTPQNVQDGWLVYVPRKTSRAKPTTVEVPLSATAREIVNRYQGADLRGRLFPFVSEQSYNEAIHNILRTCACTRPVMVYDPRTQQTSAVPLWKAATSHTARKTFTQIMYAATHDKRLVAALTGHSENSQAFNRYSEISRDIKQAAILSSM